ncbi:MAG: CotS family spore coat protein, partial [Clostridium perfringens]|nr:CotS family spore coat protein [Clostridium perfringens]
MEHDYIRDKILLNYGIEIKEVIKVKNTYKVITSDEEYCLKVIKYQYPHFYFIVSAQKHLMKNGFNSIPKILDTIDGKDYIKLGDKLAYLTPWVKCRECDYKNKLDLSLAAKKLSELHNSSEGFVINRNLKPRIAWGKWYKIFETRGEEILDFKKRIYQKAYMSDFDKLYLSIMDEELKRVERTLSHIKTSGYFDYMKKEVKKLGFCHHDYANHNVLL